MAKALTSQRPTHPFHGARRMRPTQRHRAAIWENMLATVYAANDEGAIRYFDYDWDAARAYAGIKPTSDPRVYRHAVNSSAPDGPRRGQLVLYVLKETT